MSHRARETLGRQQGQSTCVVSVLRAPESDRSPGQAASSPPRIWSPACTGTVPGPQAPSRRARPPGSQLTAQTSSWPPSAQRRRARGQPGETWSRSSGPTAGHGHPGKAERDRDGERQRETMIHGGRGRGDRPRETHMVQRSETETGSQRGLRGGEAGRQRRGGGQPSPTPASMSMPAAWGPEGRARKPADSAWHPSRAPLPCCCPTPKRSTQVAPSAGHSPQ